MGAWILALLAGCPSAESAELFVELRTDWLPVNEVVSIETRVRDGGGRMHRVPRAVTRDDDLFAGVRVAELAGLPVGPTGVTVVLLRAGGGTLAQRDVLVSVDAGRTVTTVVIPRSCEGVVCPGPGDPAENTQCGGAMLCVPRECTPETPEDCPPPECVADSDCGTGPVSCATQTCRAGTCQIAFDDSLCGGGATCDPTEGCGMPPIADDCHDLYPGAIFCSGFEDATLADWPGRDRSTSVVGAGAYRGTGALRGVIDGSSTLAARVWHDGIGTIATGEVWARFQAFIPASADLTHIGLWQLDALVGFVALGLQNGTPFVYNGRGESLPADSAGTGDPFPRDEWVCVEVRLRIDATAGAIEARVVPDAGSPISVALTDVDTSPTGGFDMLELGVIWGGNDAQMAAEVLIDDFVFDDAPLSCDAAP